MRGIIIKGILCEGVKKDIVIEGKYIAKVRNSGDACGKDETDLPLIHGTNEYKIIDGAGKAILPGFVNMHTHGAMTLFRGCNEDSSLKEWLGSIWRMEPRLDEELIYWGTKLACLEMIKTGTTTFNDQYWMIDSAVKAVQEMGIRSFNSFVFLENGDDYKAEKLKDECQLMYEASRKWGELSEFTVAIHAPYTNSEKTMLWVKEFADRHNLLIHTHLSETESELKESISRHGLSPIAYMDQLGILSPEVIAAHCVWISDEDIKILGRHQVKVVHNINSNLKLASGYKFKYHELKEAGATVCIGTDGCASSNNLDMLEAMKTAALLQKAWRRDPKSMPLNELLDSATKDGAYALRLNSGKIEEGRLADLVIVDIDNYAFTPCHNFMANLIYSANSACVESVICNGVCVMEHREVKGEDEIIRNVNKLYRKLFDI